MKKYEIYYTIDRFGRIKKDNFTTFINNNDWFMPVYITILILIGAWIEGNL